ncbi:MULTISPECIES: Mor transcription activator family protein [Acinetobacter calcoaceticus/baumannii complex]|uniref:Mor transcription activator family protein n=1 Tax=Acinetobacter calcoaceticus/baumannii complex TaxID=909768 RepID=UPI0001F8ADF0|nr:MULTISPECIES: Mor transcription activator family protein [Acinetobacter calcoaceticus/baumannii complex]ADX02988.1 Putative uncharacterized protein [Acinetobacter baumannii 1656-2]AOP63371.1 hypothetical protein DU202_02208 [Acinetobacter baumannii DU202]QEA26390.1 transcriptional regulator [Acinetobacter pittii]RQL52020.1 transcriptional regulator [Acinetobacter baumannii]RSP41867.1 transcriptional regulator [Acinetobacter baumannii]
MAYHPQIADAPAYFTEKEILGLIPENFIFVTQLIGIRSALNMIDEYGGTKVFIPHKHALELHHEIAQVIGLNKLQQLSEQMGNCYIEIPMGRPIICAMRNRMVRDHAEKGWSKAKLARKFGITQRRIRGILNKAEILKVHVERNLDLFE